jgi:O-antigen/teichoic acid export membrane protein
VSTGVNTALLFYTNHFKTGALLLVGAFALTVILDIIFIPTYGMIAAAIITTIMSVAYNLSKFLIIYRIFGFQPYDFNSLKISLLIMIGFVITLLMPSFTAIPTLNIIFNGSLISVFYIFCVYKLKIIPEIFAAIKSNFVKF